MPGVGRYRRAVLWVGVGLAAINFGLLDGLFRAIGERGILRGLRPLANLWWVPATVGGLAVLATRRGQLAAVIGGSQATVVGDAPDRYEIIRSTNWRHESQLIFQRSVGLSLLVATAVGAAITIILKETTEVFTAYDTPLAFLVAVGAVGFGLLAASMRATKHIQDDHTHRISVRLPDLFSAHSFHVHLRQQVEDLGYATRNEASPERSGMPAAYDDSIFLSKGGFTARKRPIPSSAPLIDDDGFVGELLSKGSAGVFAVLLGVLLYLSPGSLIVAETELKLPVMVLSLVVGSLVLAGDYLERTNHWAEIYCVTEGTIYNPETKLYDDSVDVAINHATPQVADSETSGELIVTLGAGCSPSFDEQQLQEEFESFIDSIEDLAAANQFRIVSDDLVDDADTVDDQPPSNKA